MNRLLTYLMLLIVAASVSVFSYIQYIKSDYNDSITVDEISLLSSEINNAQELPQEFIDVYNKVYSTTNMNGKLYNLLMGNYETECPCHNIARMNLSFHHRDKFKRNDYALSWKLEERFSQMECLNYLAERFDFIDNNIGIKNASEYYYNKPLENLSKTEYTGLAIMMKNPSLYNPKRNSEDFKIKLIATLVKLK